MVMFISSTVIEYCNKNGGMAGVTAAMKLGSMSPGGATGCRQKRHNNKLIQVDGCKWNSLVLVPF